MSQNPATTAADDFVISLALDQGLLHPAQVEAARAMVRAHSGGVDPAPRLLEVLMGQGLIDAKRVAGLLAKEFGMAMAPDLTNFRITGDTLELVPRALAQKHRMIPVAREAGIGRAHV